MTGGVGSETDELGAEQSITAVRKTRQTRQRM